MNVSVKYIGKRPEYTDGTFGTRITFINGESRMVPMDNARMMLKHPDVYVPGEADAPIVDKAALESYTVTHFRVNLDKRKSVESLRSEVTGMVDRFGSP